jgi:hypothetical protein
MVDAWLIIGNYDAANARKADLYDRAKMRVQRSPRLRKYEQIILADWREGDDHLRWVIRGRVGEIEAWAREIAND